MFQLNTTRETVATMMAMTQMTRNRLVLITAGTKSRIGHHAGLMLSCILLTQPQVSVLYFLDKVYKMMIIKTLLCKKCVACLAECI